MCIRDRLPYCARGRFSTAAKAAWKHRLSCREHAAFSPESASRRQRKVRGASAFSCTRRSGVSFLVSAARAPT
eukprot:9935068-Alexandrium_andersonii.AAC.1